MSSPKPPAITSSSAPDLDEVRAWLEKKIKALQFVELVAAVLALIVRLRDLNLDLVKQIAHLRRARPRAESLRRLEGQQSLPFKDEAPAAKPDKPLTHPLKLDRRFRGKRYARRGGARIRS